MPSAKSIAATLTQAVAMVTFLEMTNVSAPSPPAPSPASAKPSSEECILGGVAHLALFGGLWLVGPLLIYFWKGKQSRFLAFHSVQAILLSMLMVITGGLSMVAMFAGMAGMFASGMAESQSLAVASAIAGYVLAFAIMFTPALIAIVAGIRAFKGEMWSIPVVGRLADHIVERGVNV